MKDILSLTGDVVAAFVSHNAVPTAELSGLIFSVHARLDRIVNGAPKSEEDTQPQMAMTIRQSIRPESLGCLICGKRFKTLKRHVGTHHHLSLDEYKATFGLSKDYPTTAPNYSEHRTTLARSSGLGRKAKTSDPEPEAQTIAETVSEAAVPMAKPAKAKAKAKPQRAIAPHLKPEKKAKKSRAAEADAEASDEVPEAA